jgi:prephenate dehydrogenase
MAQNFLIIGVGFMGGSLALALRESGLSERILGLDRSESAIEKALSMGVIDEGWTEPPKVDWNSAETVVISTPVGTFREIASLIKGYLKDGVIITDLGSVKGKLVHDLEKILGERYVGGHPIAGTEKSGVENCLRDLFRGKRVILTPTEKTDRQALEKVREMWSALGSIVEEMDPYLHDWVFGAVSHLPHAVAFALIDALIEMSREVDLFMYPGAGFKDFTRIAKSDPVMWRDIFLENSENTAKAIDIYISSLKRLRKLITDGKEKELTEFLKEAKERRMELE